jgi:cellulose 1,4-beta-cellobiosidase
MGNVGSGGTAGAGMAGASGTGGAAGAGCNCMLKVQYECRQNGASVPQAEYSLKVVNTGTTSISLSNVSVRYWYTIDGTGAQAGTCASTAHPCTIAFQSPAANKPTADQYAVISFASGALAPGADTGEIQVTMHGSGNYNQMNDYSFDNTGANFADEMHITGYVSGKLVWGTAP